MTQNNPKKLIIVGGGHASLPLIKMGEKWKQLGIEIVLVSENPYLIYSGALPQFMGGFYSWEQTAVDLEKLCETYGVSFTESRVVSIYGESSHIKLSNGTQLSYDYLVINVGAKTVQFEQVTNAAPVKPMNELLSVRQRLKDGEIKKVLIAGGGAAGAELALNLSHPDSFTDPEITILDKNDRLLSGFPERLSDTVAYILNERKVQVNTNLEFEPAMTNHYDATIIAVGNQPGSMSISHNFKTGKGGRILTDQSLRVIGQPAVFAAGDTANVDGKNYRQIGVHAVKQGVVLRKNIKALHRGEAMTDYSAYLINPLILSDGPDSAFYILNSLVLKGRWAAILKYTLDMRWIEKYTKPQSKRRSFVKLFQDGIERSY